MEGRSKYTWWKWHIEDSCLGDICSLLWSALPSAVGNVHGRRRTTHKVLRSRSTADCRLAET